MGRGGGHLPPPFPRPSPSPPRPPLRASKHERVVTVSASWSPWTSWLASWLNITDIVLVNLDLLHPVTSGRHVVIRGRCVYIRVRVSCEMEVQHLHRTAFLGLSKRGKGSSHRRMHYVLHEVSCFGHFLLIRPMCHLMVLSCLFLGGHGALWNLVLYLLARPIHQCVHDTE